MKTLKFTSIESKGVDIIVLFNITTLMSFIQACMLS